MMSGKDKDLYGAKRKNNTLTLNNDFASQMTAAIAASQSGSKKRVTPKDDLFTAKRPSEKKQKTSAAKATTQKSKGLNIKAVVESSELNDDDWARAKRKMEEKSRIYSALKRGDIEDENQKYGVDFDRKWAERHPEQGFSEQEDSSDDEPAPEAELVEYVDEMGRTRKGTRRDARLAALTQSGEFDQGKAGYRAPAPEGVIYGDAIQVEAFDPDAPIAVKMAALAAQRDKEPTPPPAVHYDADSEIRQKGTGFFKFSKDEAERERQMQELDEERKRTEELRGQKKDDEEEARERRAKQMEERRRVMLKKKEQKEADDFLQGLERNVSEGALGGRFKKGNDDAKN